MLKLLKFFGLIFFIGTLGCKESIVPVLKNDMSSIFFQNYNLGSDDVSVILNDGVLVLPFFSPVEDYDRFEIGIVAFSSYSDKSVVIKSIEVDKNLLTFNDSLKLRENDVKSGLFRVDKFYSKFIDFKDVKEKGNVRVVVTTEVDGSVKSIPFEFNLEYNKVVAPIH